MVTENTRPQATRVDKYGFGERLLKNWLLGVAASVFASYRVHHWRASGWAASNASESSAATAGGVTRDNWASRPRTYANGSTWFALALAIML